MNQSTKLIQNLSKEIKGDNLCYRKVVRSITKWGAIEKSPILLSLYWKKSKSGLYITMPWFGFSENTRSKKSPGSSGLKVEGTMT